MHFYTLHIGQLTGASDLFQKGPVGLPVDFGELPEKKSLWALAAVENGSVRQERMARR